MTLQQRFTVGCPTICHDVCHACSVGVLRRQGQVWQSIYGLLAEALGELPCASRSLQHPTLLPSSTCVTVKPRRRHSVLVHPCTVVQLVLLLAQAHPGAVVPKTGEEIPWTAGILPAAAQSESETTQITVCFGLRHMSEHVHNSHIKASEFALQHHD